MIKNDYLAELGMEPTAPRIRWPAALVILAVLATAVIWLAVAQHNAPHAAPPPADQAAAVTPRPAAPGGVPAAARPARPKSPAHGLG